MKKRILGFFIALALSPVSMRSSAVSSQGQIFKKTLDIAEEHYVDPDRLNITEMFREAIRRIEATIPEVFVKKSDEKKILLQVGQAQKSFPLPSERDTVQAGQLMEKVLAFILQHYKGSPSPPEIERLAITGAIASRDPHSDFLSPRLYKEFKIGTRGNFGGLGIVIGIRDNALTVIAPLEGTPAAKAGVRTNDRIVTINGRPTDDLSLLEAVEALRGKIGTVVAIGLEREGHPGTIELVLTRDKIHIRSIQSAWLETCQGAYIRIRNFQEDTNKDFTKALGDLKKNHALMKGLILDLRNDPGGLLDEAVTIADRFMAEGIIVSTVGARGQVFDRRNAHEGDTEPLYPMVVLVNQGSASASEIVAGALGRQDRAVVVGETTFGKGSVQSVYDLRDGSALKLTIAHYLIGGTQSIQNTGITPDIRLVTREMTDEGFDLFPNEAPRESDLEGHFGDKKLAPSLERVAYTLAYVDARSGREIDTSSYQESPDVSKDVPVQLACDIVGRASTWRRSEILKEIKPTVRAWETSQEKKLVEILSKKGIDWSAPRLSQGKPQGIASLSFHPPLPWKGGTEARVSLSVANTGTASFVRLLGNTDSTFPFLRNREFILGRIDPGQTRSATINVKIPSGIPNRQDAFAVRFYEATGKVPPTVEQTVRLQSDASSRFAYAYRLFEDGQFGSRGNGDKIIAEGETLALVAWVKNVGPFRTDHPTLHLELPSESPFTTDKGVIKLKSMAPQATDKRIFTLMTGLLEADLSPKIFLEASSQHQAGHEESVEIDLAAPIVTPEASGAEGIPPFLVPPTITLTHPVGPVLTDEKTLNVAGVVADEKGLTDLVIFTGVKKVHYAPLQNQKKANFSVPISLESGSNPILILARDIQGTSSKLQIMVTRRP